MRPGVAAVADGGVSSALPGGELLLDMKKLLSKFLAIWDGLFFGDADTALNFEFSREAVKLAGALPGGVCSSLPRIPFGGPNGIDDCREEFGGEFQAFWEGIKVEAVEVGVEMDMSTLAAELLVLGVARHRESGGRKEKVLKARLWSSRDDWGRWHSMKLPRRLRSILESVVGPFKEEVARARGASGGFCAARR